MRASLPMTCRRTPSQIRFNWISLGWMSGYGSFCDIGAVSSVTSACGL